MSLARATSIIFQVSAQTRPPTGIKEALSNSIDHSILLYLLCLPMEPYIFFHNDIYHTDYNCIIIHLLCLPSIVPTSNSLCHITKGYVMFSED